MRAKVIAGVLSLVCAACGPTIHGYPLRESRVDESRQVAEVLEPLLLALELPSLRQTGLSDCKIGFAVVRTERVNVWSAPRTASPCLYFTILLTEGALRMPPDQLMATLAHELGHLVLQHTPQSDAVQPAVSAGDWHTVHAQELEADRFAVALLKRTQRLYRVGSCEALARFLRRSVPDWYGTRVTTRMEEALRQRVESADAACASPEPPPPPRPAPAAGVP